jgi:hypothetical protein
MSSPNTSTPNADMICEILGDDREDILQIDGHDNAILGYTSCLANQNRPVLVYDREIIIQNLVRDGMDVMEAVEFYDFNISQAYMGEATPLIIDTSWKETLNEVSLTR